MKIGIVASHIYRPDDKELSNISTGLAITLYDIISHYSSDNKILYFTTKQRVKNKQYDNVEVAETRIQINDLLRYISLRDLVSASKVVTKSGVKSALKNLYYSIMYKKFIELMVDFKPEVIHFHDLTEQTVKLIEHYVKTEIKCFLTLHIYIGNKQNEALQKTYQELALLEAEVLSYKNLNISVISSGMKRRILEDYPNIDKNKISVILDGTVNRRNPISENINYDKWINIGQHRKLLLCIGTIMKRKNQEQVLRALSICKEELGNNCPYVLFLGHDTTKGAFESSIALNGLTDVANYVGNVPAEEMGIFYQAAYGVISASINEAFGLTLIEGFQYGIPCVYFDDIDASDDIYDPDAVIKVYDRSDVGLAKGMLRLINNKWDTEKIMMHGSKFSIVETSLQYINLYSQEE